MFSRDGNGTSALSSLSELIHMILRKLICVSLLEQGVGLDGLHRSAELQPFYVFVIGQFSSGKLAPQHMRGIKLSAFRCITTVVYNTFFSGFSLTYLSSCNIRRSSLILPKLVISTDYSEKSERDTQKKDN